MDTLKVGIIGTGVVGYGVYELIKKHQTTIKRRTGLSVKIVCLCSRNIKKRFSKNLKEFDKNIDLIENYQELIRRDDIDVILELVGGTRVAYDIIKKSLKNGKHVITANKAVMAKYTESLLGLARKYQREIYFEASIGGGIPIIKIIREALAGNQIKEIHCIINGTSNYILSQMIQLGKTFEQALKEAQEKGFAEADPTLDINGADAAQKTSLLSLLAFNSLFNAKDIYFEGITKIKNQDVEMARKFNYKIKLLGISKLHGKKKVEIRVHPTLIPANHELANVENEYNAVHLNSDFQSNSLYLGKGAGSHPTASAVVSDICDMGHLIQSSYSFNPYRYTPFNDFKLLPISETKSSYYLRILAVEKLGVLSDITHIFNQCQISINSMEQSNRDKKTAQIVFFTHLCKEANLLKALNEIGRLKTVRGKPSYIRIVDL